MSALKLGRILLAGIGATSLVGLVIASWHHAGQLMIGLVAMVVIAIFGLWQSKHKGQ